jgi:hypothetical protein
MFAYAWAIMYSKRIKIESVYITLNKYNLYLFTHFFNSFARLGRTFYISKSTNFTRQISALGIFHHFLNKFTGIVIKTSIFIKETENTRNALFFSAQS